MELFYKIISLLGGLSMFLYGMRLMGDSLKSSSGTAMKAALAKVTNKPAIGFLFGMLVTCMIQSSTATIVLTVGLVGAGFLTFRQSVGIVLGANVGTAITAQIIRLMDVSADGTSLLYFFKADNLAPLALLIGMILIMFIKKDSAKNAGSILVGFGILFMGLISMSGSVAGFGDSLSTFLTSFEDNYILGFLAGVIVTGIIQSSSAVIGILQSMASSVGLRFCAVFSIILGVNIGDCLTTFLVSRIGAKPDQIRTALVHVIYNIIASLLIVSFLFIGRITGLIGDNIWYMTLNSGGVANVHGIFRLVPAVLMIPFSGMLATMAEKIVKDEPVNEEDEEVEEYLRLLDEHLVSNATLALDQSKKLVVKMGDLALKNYESMVSQIHGYDPAREERMHTREGLLDKCADAGNNYIIKITPYLSLDKETRDQSLQMKAITVYERIGDLEMNISYNMESLSSHQKQFSDEAHRDLQILIDAVTEILSRAYKAYRKDSLTLARQIEPLEEVVDELVKKMKKKHINRMVHEQCDVYAGIQYENILSYMERISDQCSDLAVYMISSKIEGVSGNEHQYVHDIHHSNDAIYQKTYDEAYEKYVRRLNKHRDEKSRKNELVIKEA